MPARRILIVQGHPDATGAHFGHALAARYAAGADQAGHTVRRLELARLDFPLLRSQAEWETGAPVSDIVAAQRDIAWAEHLVFFFPLWLGGMPALVKGFLEQVARPGFALGTEAQGGAGRKLLRGRSARVVVTMGMPALLFRWFFLAHGVRQLQRNILGFVGIAPVRTTLIGLVEGNAHRRTAWLDRLLALGSRGL